MGNRTESKVHEWKDGGGNEGKLEGRSDIQMRNLRTRKVHRCGTVQTNKQAFLHINATVTTTSSSRSALLIFASSPHESIAQQHFIILYPSNFSTPAAFFCRQRTIPQIAEKKNMILRYPSLAQTNPHLYPSRQEKGDQNAP